MICNYCSKAIDGKIQYRGKKTYHPDCDIRLKAASKRAAKSARKRISGGAVNPR